MNDSPAPSLAAPEGRILVCGGAGYIGSHFVRLLSEIGADVVVLDNLSTGHRATVGVPFEEVDLGDPAALEDVFGRLKPRAVVHFAAKCYVGESVDNPAKYYRENVSNTLQLLETMRRHECKQFVFSSTCATFGNPVQVPMGEDHPQDPINPYGRTKLHVEHMLQDFGEAYGLEFASLRYFNAAGASPDGELGEDHDPETHLIPIVLQVAAGRRDKVLVFGDDYDTRDGTCVRDYIHVCDLADAHVRALNALQAGRRRLFCNLGTGEGFTVREVIETAREVTGHGIPAEVAARRSGDPPVLVSGGTRARDLLGWEPRYADLRTIVEHAWAFHQRHPDGFSR